MNLVELALACPPEERQTYIMSVCGDDTELMQEVWKYVAGEERMNGFLLEPLIAPIEDGRPFEPGELIEGRFRIVHEVAEGGMGFVYEAQDEKLDRRVAIKCAKPGFRRRLPPEVRHASTVAHPNVCKLFEIHTASAQHGGIDFLTMEFLDGETLSSRLRRGPLPEPEAREIATQLCAGVAEAHRNQIIHGDLKSNNVILTRAADGSLRAVITDFGLARRPETTQQTVQSGAQGGTPAYMAPELWRGEKASIASDIFALGVILYEMVAGRDPFDRALSWNERFQSRPPAAHPKWDRVLAKCLEVDPKDRYQDAAEVASDLAPHSKRWMWVAAAVVVLAAISGLISYRQAKAPKETVRLAVLPFETDADAAPLVAGVQRDAEERLSRVGSSSNTKFVLIPSAQVSRRGASSPGGARSILKATHALHVRLSRDGEKIVVHIELIDTLSTAANQWNPKYAADEVAKYAPIALAGFATETLHLPGPPAPGVNPAAWQDYRAGLAILESDSQRGEAIRLLERAAVTDPTSPLPFAGLAEAQYREFLVTGDKAWFEKSSAALEEAQRRNPDVVQVHLIAGLLQARMGRYEEAIPEYQRAIELQPQNSNGHRRLGMALRKTNQPQKAMVEFQQAITADSTDFYNYWELGSLYNDLADYNHAAEQFKKMADLAPKLPDSHLNLAYAYRELGRPDESETEVRKAIAIADTSKAEQFLGFTLMLEGRDDEAITAYWKAIHLSAHNTQYTVLWMDLAVSCDHVGRKADMIENFRKAIAFAEEEINLVPSDGLQHAYMAYSLARVGDTHRAEGEIAQALHLGRADSEVQWMAALTYEALHHRDDTLRLLATVPTAVLRQLSRYPDMAELRQDGRFIDLLGSRQDH
jgi:tetratricopeptide (TPR) repeat protein